MVKQRSLAGFSRTGGRLSGRRRYRGCGEGRDGREVPSTFCCADVGVGSMQHAALAPCRRASMYPRPHAHIVPRIRSSSVFEDPRLSLYLPTPNITKVPPLFLGSTAPSVSFFSFLLLRRGRRLRSLLPGIRNVAVDDAGSNARDPRRNYFSQNLTDKRTPHVRGSSFLTTPNLTGRPLLPRTTISAVGQEHSSTPPQSLEHSTTKLLDVNRQPTASNTLATPTATRATNRADLPSLK